MDQSQITETGTGFYTLTHSESTPTRQTRTNQQNLTQAVVGNSFARVDSVAPLETGFSASCRDGKNSDAP